MNQVVPQRRVFGEILDYKKYYGPGLKRASVEDLARAAGGMEAAMRAADAITTSCASYANALSSFLEPASVNLSNASCSRHVKSAWRVQNLTYNESYIGLNRGLEIAALEHGSTQIDNELEDDLLPDREFILMWCRQNGLGHLETSALDGTGVETAIQAVVMLVLSASRSTENKDAYSNEHRVADRRKYRPKINFLMENANAGSLGAFTDEIMEIFDAMRVRKSETKIHCHEFIAAGFSHCKLDYGCNNKLICFNFVVDIIFIFTLNKNCCFVPVFLFVLCFGVSCIRS